MSVGPWPRYQFELKNPDFVHDVAQEAVVRRLQALYQQLTAPGDGQGLLGKVLGRQPVPVRGLYLWGGVGRGKTWLMDMFADCLPADMRLRLHFHRFMYRVHKALVGVKSEQNPLSIVAGQLAGSARVLCFDEFFVSDIGDAMLLAGLLEALFERGVTLVATSNIPPAELYRNGLQRARFLPSIDLIERHCDVMELGGDTDYRLRFLEQAEIYHSPLDAEAARVLEDNFDHVAPEQGVRDSELEINGRMICTVRRADDVVWFAFDEICGGPRSAADYVEIARCFHCVLISDVPVLGSDQNDEARRFISLVDEFYDRNVKLILSAAAPMDDLYRGKRQNFEFERTRSRLMEMQSHEYLAKPHLP
ncbi:MAG: cell division protein ZapE [Gammaproteobacteria bacterium]|nr:MAG: cell division protein ZapE [Gammaproteobacteria bacterium]